MAAISSSKHQQKQNGEASGFVAFLVDNPLELDRDFDEADVDLLVVEMEIFLSDLAGEAKVIFDRVEGGAELTHVGGDEEGIKEKAWDASIFDGIKAIDLLHELNEGEVGLLEIAIVIEADGLVDLV